MILSVYCSLSQVAQCSCQTSFSTMFRSREKGWVEMRDSKTAFSGRTDN